MLSTLLSEWHTWFTSLLLVLVTAAAATSRLPDGTVRAYLTAELAGTIVLETSRHLSIGFDTDYYRVLYCLALLPIRVLACMVAARQSRWMSAGALPFALGLLYFSTRGFRPTIDQWISIVDGVVVTSAGLGLAFSAAFSSCRRVYATLTILWMLLGIFDFGFALQPYGRWRDLNDSLLPVMVIGAFGWIAFSARSGRSVPSVASHR